MQYSLKKKPCRVGKVLLLPTFLIKKRWATKRRCPPYMTEAQMIGYDGVKRFSFDR
ncbi:hypothetical protein QUF54_07160 [Candidatus Marithioploca araucensis]|uniref:Uncharacterized protein n=1 Tax=Candidatus Marithioploca araucensis TaxID=70273 RepID=A0ABT7VU54_9GAMM|nr:hypothetical protein [Candidatus Marithioploca araucensis]